MSSLAETARGEWVSTWAFAHRNIIMARRNVFFLFELTFWPGVAMLSHGLLTRFLDLTPQMTAFILVGTVSLSAVQVCQLDVAYAVLFDIWSKSMKHQFLAPVRIYHLALGSWIVGVARGSEGNINALRALAPLPRAPVSRPSRPQPRTPQPRWSRRHSSARSSIAAPPVSPAMRRCPVGQRSAGDTTHVGEARSSPRL